MRDVIVTSPLSMWLACHPFLISLAMVSTNEDHMIATCADLRNRLRFVPLLFLVAAGDSIQPA